MQTLRLPLMMKMEFDLLLSVRLLCSEKIFNFHRDQSEHDDQLIRSGLYLGIVIRQSCLDLQGQEEGQEGVLSLS